MHSADLATKTGETTSNHSLISAPLVETPVSLQMGIGNGNSLSLAEAFFNMELVAKLNSSDSKFFSGDRSIMDSGRKKVSVYGILLQFYKKVKHLDYLITFYDGLKIFNYQEMSDFAKYPLAKK